MLLDADGTDSGSHPHGGGPEGPHYNQTRCNNDCTVSVDDATVVRQQAQRSQVSGAVSSMPEPNLTERVAFLERKVRDLEALPARMAGVELQIVQLREEMRVEFSAVRQDIAGVREEIAGVRGDLRGELQTTAEALRKEIREGDEETRREMRTLNEELRREMHEMNDETVRHMRVLHQEVLTRIAMTREGRRPNKRKPRT